MQYFIYKVQTENHLSEKTTKDCIGIIRQIIADGQEEGIIPEFIISRRRLKYKKQELIGNEKKTYTEEEYRKIINEILKNIDHVKLGILLGLFTGIRIGELCALQFKVEPSKIIISTPKTATSIRNVPITDNIIKILKTLNTGNDNYIITGKSKYTEPRTFRRKYTLFMESIGIEALKFHSLRHTFASMNIESGTDVKTISEILGHSNIDVTLKVYTHSSQKAKQKAIDKFNKKFTESQKKKQFNLEYKGHICCISKKNGRLDFIGTIAEVASYLSITGQKVCQFINEGLEHSSYYIVPKIEGITHKNGEYMGG